MLSGRAAIVSDKFSRAEAIHLGVLGQVLSRSITLVVPSKKRARIAVGQLGYTKF